MERKRWCGSLEDNWVLIGAYSLFVCKVYRDLERRWK